MSATSQWRRAILIAVAAFACDGGGWLLAGGSEPAPPVAADRGTVLDEIDQHLQPVIPEALAAAREQALASLAKLEQTLATQAAGSVLAVELRLAPLRKILCQVSPETASADAASLGPSVSMLQRVLPGRAQHDLDRLRHAVSSLAALARRTPETLAEARDAVAMLCRPLGKAATDTDREADRQQRAAFATVAALTTDARLIADLRKHLSHPNAVILLRPSFVEHLARQTFTQPVDFHRCEQGTAITARGSIDIDLSATLQASDGTCRLLMQAAGEGAITTTAVQRRGRIAAAASPRVLGTMPIVIDPRTITGGDPSVTARLTTRLQQLSINGLLGRSRLVQRVAARAVQQKLTANDPVAADELQAAISREVREQGLLYASRINALLTWGVWDRLAAIDFQPEVRLASGREGASSHTFYARGSQLASLTPSPVAHTVTGAPFDLVTQIHESAVSNLFATFGGLELDEATVRALWEVQLKLIDEAWELLPAARQPSAIQLADSGPLDILIDDDRVRLVLRVVGGRLTDSPLAVIPEEIHLEYRLDHDPRGLVFRRGPAEITGPLNEASRADWEQLIDLFFGRNLRPLPRYHTSGVADSLTVTHATLHAGWLTVAARRAEEEPTSPQSEAVRQDDQ